MPKLLCILLILSITSCAITVVEDDPKVGEKWATQEDNPFDGGLVVFVLNIKANYVQYKYVDGTLSYSLSLPTFKRLFSIYLY